MNSTCPFDLVIGLDRSDRKADLYLIHTASGQTERQTIGTSPEALPPFDHESFPISLPPPELSLDNPEDFPLSNLDAPYSLCRNPDLPARQPIPPRP